MAALANIQKDDLKKKKDNTKQSHKDEKEMSMLIKFLRKIKPIAADPGQQQSKLSAKRKREEPTMTHYVYSDKYLKYLDTQKTASNTMTQGERLWVMKQMIKSWGPGTNVHEMIVTDLPGSWQQFLKHIDTGDTNQAKEYLQKNSDFNEEMNAFINLDDLGLLIEHCCAQSIADKKPRTTPSCSYHSKSEVYITAKTLEIEMLKRHYATLGGAVYGTPNHHANANPPCLAIPRMAGFCASAAATGMPGIYFDVFDVNQGSGNHKQDSTQMTIDVFDSDVFPDFKKEIQNSMLQGNYLPIKFDGIKKVDNIIELINDSVKKFMDQHEQAQNLVIHCALDAHKKETGFENPRNSWRYSDNDYSTMYSALVHLANTYRDKLDKVTLLWEGGYVPQVLVAHLQKNKSYHEFTKSLECPNNKKAKPDPTSQGAFTAAFGVP